MLRVSIFPFAVLCLLLLSACEQSMLDQGSTNNSLTGSTDYRAVAHQDAIDAGIRADYFVAQINQESGFRPDVVSYAGAIGIAQIMNSTADSWNVNPWDPIASLKVASQHMAWYQNTYGSYEKALACYNAGCSSLLYAESHCIDFYWCLPAQTRGYITNITGYV
jgi:soluble lytic murein transglycosylase-like protein